MLTPTSSGCWARVAAPARLLQVLSWSERMVAAGEAFSGTECAALRSMLTRQSSAFFAAYHDSNLEGLQSMLDKELWRRLPLLPDGAALVWWLQVVDTNLGLQLICFRTGCSGSDCSCHWAHRLTNPSVASSDCAHCDRGPTCAT